MRKLLLLMMVTAMVVACQEKQDSKGDFVRVEDGHFMRGNKPYYYVGTNFWYGAILGGMVPFWVRKVRGATVPVLPRNWTR